MRFVVNGYSDPGMVRSNNEDFFHIDPDIRLFVVCDGMGGHEAGEVAAELCAYTVARYLADHDTEFTDLVALDADGGRARIRQLMADAIQQACGMVYASAQANPSQRGMGTTCTAMLLAGRHAFVAHVGDSRAYLLRGDRVVQITTDHTLLQEAIHAGFVDPADAARHVDKNILTRAVGVMPQVAVDAVAVEAVDGDRFLLCSDGLAIYMDAPEIGGYLREATSFDDLCRLLVDIANERGGRDNITVVALEVAGVPASATEPEPPVKLSTLARTELFGDFGYNDLVYILNSVSTRRVPAGTDVFRAGEPAEALHVLIDGSVEVRVEDQVVATLGASEHFGEMALLTNEPRVATVRATTDCRLLCLPRAEFDRLMGTDPRMAARVSLRLAVTLAHRLRDMNRSLAGERQRSRSLLAT